MKKAESIAMVVAMSLWLILLCFPPFTNNTNQRPATTTVTSASAATAGTDKFVSPASFEEATAWVEKTEEQEASLLPDWCLPVLVLFYAALLTIGKPLRITFHSPSSAICCSRILPNAP